MISRIYIVSKDKETKETATDLSALLSETQGSSLRRRVLVDEFYYDTTNPFTEEKQETCPQIDELENIVFLGHTDDRGTFGGFNAEKFVARFAKAFKPKPKKSLLAKAYEPLRKMLGGDQPFSYEDRTRVKDLYFIGCQIGLSNKGKNDSLAQQLVNTFHDEGFSQVRVHAVAYEKQYPNESMYVEVIWWLASGDTKTKEGYLTAHSLDERTVLEIRPLEHLQNDPKTNEASKEEARGRIKHLCALAKTKRGSIVTSAPPLDFLNQAENTFIAYQTPRQRKQYIADDSNHKARRELSDQRQRVIDLIGDTIISMEKNKKEKEKVELLRELLEELKRNKLSTWQESCENYKEKYEKKFSFLGLGLMPKNSIHKLLEQLSKGNLPSQPKLDSESREQVEGRYADEEKQPLISPSNKSLQFTSVLKQKGALTNNSTKHAADSAALKIEVLPLIENKKAVEPKIPDDLKNKIEDLMSKLDREIKDLRKRLQESCFPFFINHEIATKTQKYDCLSELSELRTLEELQKKAKEYLEDDSDEDKARIKRGFINTCTKEWGVSRTTKMLHAIVNCNNLDQAEPSRRKLCC